MAISQMEKTGCLAYAFGLGCSDSRVSEGPKTRLPGSIRAVSSFYCTDGFPSPPESLISGPIAMP